MKVLVCGGRDFTDQAAVSSALDAMLKYHPKVSIIEGGAAGADMRARIWAENNSISCITFRADWKTHGKAAGPIRNRRMLEEGKPDLVLAFSGGRGTENMISQAEKAGVKVIRIAPTVRGVTV